MLLAIGPAKDGNPADGEDTLPAIGMPGTLAYIASDVLVGTHQHWRLRERIVHSMNTMPWPRTVTSVAIRLSSAERASKALQQPLSQRRPARRQLGQLMSGEQ